MSLKVGEFSRLCQVPVKTLRYYDEIGLFAPSQIDRFTSYRYYTLEQLPRIHRIMALKELGLSLEQIAQLLDSNLESDQLHEMFLDKQREVQGRVEAELERLALVKFHLRQIEMESKMPELQIVVKRIDPFLALTLRNVFPTQQDIDQTGLEIMKATADGALKPVAIPMGIAYTDEFRRHDLDFEFVLPLDSPNSQAVALETRGALSPALVPGLEMAATYMHQGDHDGLNHALVLLQRWAVENGYELGSEMRMIYYRGPMHRVAPAEYLTEIQHHVKKLDRP
jgi:DNA-binding transcriptional MerR regulator